MAGTAWQCKARHVDAQRREAWPGRQGAAVIAGPGLAGLGVAMHGRRGMASHRMAWPGAAWLGGAGLGRQGASAYGTSRQGDSWHGQAGMARHGHASLGRADLGAARRGTARQARQARRGLARRGMARHGKSGPGGAWQASQAVVDGGRPGTRFPGPPLPAKASGLTAKGGPQPTQPAGDRKDNAPPMITEGQRNARQLHLLAPDR